jgi:hypothetical protein
MRFEPLTYFHWKSSFGANCRALILSTTESEVCGLTEFFKSFEWIYVISNKLSSILYRYKSLKPL